MADPASKQRIREHMQATTIPEELRVLNLLANATQILSLQCFERIKEVYRANGYQLKENDMISGISQYCDMEKKACFFFSQRVDPMIVRTTFGIGGTKSFDAFAEDSNELIRLILLYIDRCAEDKDAYGRVFKTLRQLPSKEIFTDKDISRFKMK